jgi:uncharacterized protein (DUF427 family)
MKAYWNGQLLAESIDTVVVENNHYFPRSSLRMEFFQDSDKKTTCSWKGVAHYYSIIVDGEINQDAAWYYPEPEPAASEIKDHVAFWRGVLVSDE